MFASGIDEGTGLSPIIQVKPSLRPFRLSLAGRVEDWRGVP
jgi:hypothetical protein